MNENTKLDSGNSNVNENSDFNIGEYINSIRSTNTINWSEVIEKYNDLKPEYKLKSKIEIQRYVNDLNTIDIVDKKSKDSQLHEGIEEILDYAENGRWIRHELSKLELSENLTKTEREAFDINHEKEEREAVKEREKEERILKRIQEKFRKFFEKNKNNE